jgi:hypothetical protein
MTAPRADDNFNVHKLLLNMLNPLTSQLGAPVNQRFTPCPVGE